MLSRHRAMVRSGMEHLMLERRNEFRLDASRLAKIVAGREAPIDCKVENISGSGGCLKVDAAVALPESFQLVPGEGAGSGYPCRMVWRKDNHVGIKFDY